MLLKACLGVYRTFDKTEVLETMMTDGLLGEVVYLLDAEVSLTVTAEQVDGKNFLIRKFGIGIVTESLAVETQRRLIDITDIHIQTY